MANYRKKSAHRFLKIFLALLLLAAAALAVWYFYFRHPDTPATPDPTQPQPQSQIQPQTNPPEVSTETNPTPETSDDPKHQTQNEGSDPNQSKTLTGVLTRADVANNKLILRVNIDQYLSGGSCSLKLTNAAGKSYEDSANIIDSASTSTCEGFDAPVEKLEKGSWSLSIKLTSGDKEGTISGKVNI